MAITEQDVARIAKLARIEISPDQTPRAQADLSRMLGLIEKLQAVDTSGVEPMAHPLAAHQEIQLRLREDRATETQSEAQRNALMRSAPAQEGGLFLVPTVIE